MVKIDVVAAVISDGKKFFIAQRDESKHLGGQWEFPGGKIDSGETPHQALVREMVEEFDTQVSPGRLLGDVQHTYPDREIHLFFYEASVLEGALQPLEHQDTLWADMSTLLNGGLLAQGDLTFVKTYLKELYCYLP